jgi:hypothetical protein
MVRFIAQALRLLAIGNMVTANPAGILPSKSVAPLVTSPAGTKTSTAVPASTGKIEISDAALDAAPVASQPQSNASLVSIPGKADNSTLVAARPDLQTHVQTTLVNSTSKVKRDIVSFLSNLPHDLFTNI